MCRMVVFGGTCIRCAAYYTVPELEQNVSCLEAKNNGAFGDCGKGIMMDEHDPAFECAACSSALGMMDDAGNGNDELIAAAAAAGGGSSSGSSSSSSTGGSPGSSRSHHHSHHHHGSSSSSKSKGSKGKGSSSSGSSSGSYDPMKRRRVR